MKLLPPILCALAFFLWPARSYPAGATGRGELSFPTRILPILTKAGCNAGACHGAATGQGGFRLSLVGFDPGDYAKL